MWAGLAELLGGFGALLVRILSSRIGGIVVSLLLTLGVSMTTYHFAIGPFRTLIANSMSSGGQWLNWAGFLGIDQAITITLSAIAVKYAVQGAKIALTKRA